MNPLKKKPITLKRKWENDSKDSLHVWGKDGSEKIIYPNGKVKYLKKGKK